MCTINKSAHTEKKSRNLTYVPRTTLYFEEELLDIYFSCGNNFVSERLAELTPLEK